MADGAIGEVMLRRTNSTLVRRTLDGVLLYSLQMERPIRLSSPGDAIWSLLASPQTFHGLTRSLADLFGVPEAAVAGDLDTTIALLVAEGAIYRETTGT